MLNAPDHRFHQLQRALGQILLPAVAIVALAVPLHAQQEGDPPAEVARVSVALGTVSVEPASVDQFSAAEVNDPLTTGDRIYADAGSNAELETGMLAVRLGQQTDLTVTAMTDQLEQFGLAQGSVHLRSFNLQQGTTVELDTPNASVTVLEPGDVRVDVDPNSGITTVALISGQAQVSANGFEQVLEQGQGVQLEGTNPVNAQPLDAMASDGLDRFSNDRDAAYESAVQGEDAYVNPDTIGAEDLSANGDWETDSDDGAVWYPTGVAVGWTPYSSGHWTWLAPWGWTWVDSYSWGFAPFHYGRWTHRGNRWGWVPGPPVVRPIYSPAMVAFVGGAGVTAWFPLGPHETYVPWYNASPRYMNRVNTASIHDADAAQVRARYNQPTLASQYASPGAHGYANRPVGTVVVAQASFAAGRPVSQARQRGMEATLTAAPVLPHPLVTPQRTMVVGTAARAVPPHVGRPALSSRATETAPSAGVTRQSPQGSQPTQRQQFSRPTQQQPEISQPTRQQPEISRPTQQQQEFSRPAPQQPESPAHNVSPQQQQLFHQAQPPQPRPSFEQQQKAIETTDPGRPLGPQQLENLRQNRPAGPPQQREIPHPAPEPRAAPAPHAPDPHPTAPKH